MGVGYCAEPQDTNDSSLLGIHAVPRSKKNLTGIILETGWGVLYLEYGHIFEPEGVFFMGAINYISSDAWEQRWALEKDKLRKRKFISTSMTQDT